MLKLISFIVATVAALVLLAAPASATGVNSHHCHHVKHHGWVVSSFSGWGPWRPHIILTPCHPGSKPGLHHVGLN
jgi:hypothetical protein